MPSLRQPASTQSCITCQIRSRPARVSAGRQAFSFSAINWLIDRPSRTQWSSSCRAVLKGNASGVRSSTMRSRPAAVVDHETAAHRVVLAAADLQAGGVEGTEDHAVGMVGQRLADQRQVFLLDEADRPLAEQAQLAAGTDGIEPGGNRGGIHRVRLLALQAEQYRLVAAVALPVAPSEPYSSTLTLAVASSNPSRLSPSAKRAAARIGPTVWELDGPMPILNRSKTLRDMLVSA